MVRRTAKVFRTGFSAALVVALSSALLVVPSASAQTPVGEADFSGYATSTVVHLHALESGDMRIEDTEVAFSGATVGSTGLTDQKLNEVTRVVQPAQEEGIRSYARGSGLEIGVLVSPPEAENTLELAGLAEAAAPPSTGPVTEEIGPVALDPVAYANTLRGQATARWLDNTCILGNDISKGVGYAENLQLLGQSADADGLDAPILGTFAPQNDRAVSNSVSRTALTPQHNALGEKLGENFGLVSETRQTIAPVTLLTGTDQQVTIEFLGEWVLRAVASGVPGGAYVHYGPGETSPQTDILRLIDADGQTTDLIKFQDLLGPEGLAVELGELGEIVLGEDPRAIGGNAESDPTATDDGTQASAGVDVARIILNVPGVTVADLRVGHMEVQAQVPAGGISCPLPVTKVATPEFVDVGQQFTTNITINNPYDCDLTQVQVTDEITTVGAARFRVVGTNPTADTVPAGDSLASGNVVWNDVGPIASGESVTISVTLEAVGGAGRIDDIARASAVLANCEGEDAAVAGSAVSAAGAGLVGASNAVRVPVGAVAGAVLARTGPGAFATMFSGLALLGLSLLGLRSTRRRFL